MERNTEQRKQYDEPFKQAAVQFFQRSGQTVEEAASELGLNPSELRSWKRKYGMAGEEKGAKSLTSVAQLRAENRALRDEILHLKVQWDVLKTTLGILSTTVGQRENAV